jgi:hypothetical protein
MRMGRINKSGTHEVSFMRFIPTCLVSATVLAGSLSAFGGAAAADVPTFALTLQNHQFTPDHLTVPAGQRFLIELTNHDETTDEFESYDMKFEKIVVPGGKIAVFAGPLHPGTYKFFDDYHPDTAQGTITAEAK